MNVFPVLMSGTSSLVLKQSEINILNQHYKKSLQGLPSTVTVTVTDRDTLVSQHPASVDTCFDKIWGQPGLMSDQKLRN